MRGALQGGRQLNKCQPYIYVVSFCRGLGHRHKPSRWRHRCGFVSLYARTHTYEAGPLSILGFPCALYCPTHTLLRLGSHHSGSWSRLGEDRATRVCSASPGPRDTGYFPLWSLFCVFLPRPIPPSHRHVSGQLVCGIEVEEVLGAVSVWDTVSEFLAEK